MHYRSDWPEVGQPTFLSESIFPSSANDQGQASDRVQEVLASGATLRWIVTLGDFESGLYRFPIWSLRLTVEDPAGDMLTPQLDSAMLREEVDAGLCRLLEKPPWGLGYIYSKLVKGELLYDALLQSGFEATEYRRLYLCQVRDLVVAATAPPDRIRITSLASIQPEKHPACHEQIRDICRQAAPARHTRHYLDPFLSERLPGISYTLALMELNFQHVPPCRFLIALDTDTDQICGFSVIGKKPDLGEAVYTQLLSAVRPAYRGAGIYRGLTNLLAQTLPQDATLLNVTHVDNQGIQRAYQDSGRVHLADTVVLRRVFQGHP